MKSQYNRLYLPLAVALLLSQSPALAVEPPGKSEPAKSGARPAGQYDSQAFMEELQRRIKLHWERPKFNQAMGTRVLFRVHESGEITDIRLISSSGIAAMDKAAIRAVALTNPAPPLPTNFPAFADIDFQFSLNINGAIPKKNGPTKEAVAEQLKRANISIEKGELTQALYDLDAVASSKDPQIAQTLQKIAKAAQNKGYQSATNTILQAMRISPQNQALRAILDETLVAAGIDPKSAAAHEKLARSFLEDGQYDNALSEYKLAYSISKDPSDMNMVVKIAALQDGMPLVKKWKAALNMRDNAENHTGLGYALEMCSDWDAAESEYKKALTLDSYYEMAKTRLAALPDRATRVTIPYKVPEAAPIQQCALLNNEGVLLLKQDKFEQAILKFEQALSLNHGYSYAKDNLAIAYNNQALKLPAKQAIAYFRKALYVTPSNKASVENLSASLEAMGFKPTDFQVRVKLAQEAVQERDYKTAVVEFRQALFIKNDPEIQKKLDEALKLAESNEQVPTTPTSKSGF